MAKKIVFDIMSPRGVERAVGELREYAAWVARKEEELRVRLASLGATVASIQFSRAIYNGTNDVSVRVDNTGSTAVIYAEGESVAFIEFGAGERYGYGHPDAGKHGFGPGTYPPTNPEKPRWNDPYGWWLPKDKGGGHSYGNPPAMAMDKAVQAMAQDLITIAREVFGTA